jgi:glycosyltransferase involved in cell wall biosynthesis
MKVLVIHNRYQQPGGEDVVFAQECQLLQRYGHQVVTYERSNRELERMSSFERLVAAKNMVSAKGSRQDIRDLLRVERPDVVHAHNTFMMVSPSVYEVCQEMHVPVIQTLHNFRLLCPAWSLFRDGHVCEECPTSGLWRSVWHGCYHNSRATTAGVALMLQVHRLANTWNDSVDSYVALSEFARQKFIDGGLPRGKLQVKPNFVYPDPGESDCAGEYALYVGRLSPEKGVATLLAAWEMLATSIPLVIVGDGPLRTQLERECSEKNLSAVKFTGRLTGAETRDVIKRAAFLMVPSLWYECFPMTICEAFACGTPVLCSRLGGMQEIVADNHTGMHFVPGDAVDLAEKVERVWHDRARIARMGKEARRTYESFYTAEHNYKRLMQIYGETLSVQARN